MADSKEKTQRRVYVLPAELVDRIVAFQKETGLSSEVEAARRLLDDALKSRDSYITLVARFHSRQKETKILSEIAKEVLVGHPLVSSISFRENEITFGMTDGHKVTIDNIGKYEVFDDFSNRIDFGPTRPTAKKRVELDDDIPF